MSINFNAGPGTAQPGTDGQQTQQTQEQADSGVQKRINELTALAYRAEARAALVEEENARLRQSNVQAQQPAPKDVMAERINALPEDIRGSVGELVKAAVSESLAQHVAPLRQAQMSHELTSLGAQLGMNEQELALARKTYADWQARGIPGVTPVDAAHAVVGVANVQSRMATVARSGVSSMSVGGGAQAVAAPPAPVQTAPVPEDIEDWHPDKQYEFWAKRVGAMPK